MTERPDLSPREARDRWLDKLRVERSEQTISTYYYRLKLFTEWAEDNGIESTRELTGWDLETYEAHRRSKEITTNSLHNEFTTLKLWLEYCASIEVVDADLPEKVNVPDVPDGDASSDVKLGQDEAAALLEHYRSASEFNATRAHVLLELAWHTGARAGALVALDLRDIREADDGTRYLDFENRPQTGTRLKKGPAGERPIILSAPVWEALDSYVQEHRRDVSDEHGRQPLLAGRYGRPKTGTIRDWMYVATEPCIHSPCPHGRQRETCEWTQYEHASKCPSSRSPHQVRTGAITWMRNKGVPAEIVAERVNSSVETIEKHYDKEDPVQEMIERRADHLGGLDIQDSATDYDE